VARGGTESMMEADTPAAISAVFDSLGPSGAYLRPCEPSFDFTRKRLNGTPSRQAADSGFETQPPGSSVL